MEVGKVFIVVRIEDTNHGGESNIIHILQHIKALDISIYLVESAILNNMVSKARVQARRLISRATGRKVVEKHRNFSTFVSIFEF